MSITPDSNEHASPSSHSLTSSVTNYPLEFGRTYHRYHEGTYLYPNDAPEIDRQHLQHEIIRELNRGRVSFAPLSDPERILDVGTGTGIWPLEMAELYPNAEISGTDLSPIQPTSVPENVHFYVDDAMEDDWLWPRDHFDLIHAAILLGSLESYERMIRNAFAYLKPGGYLECHEFEASLRCDDNTVPPNPDPEDPSVRSGYALLDWMRFYHRATKIAQRPVDFATQISDWMRNAGYVDVHERIEKLPVNSWPRNDRMKRLGALNERNWLEGIAAFSYAPFGPRGLGWTQEQIEGFLVEVRRSLRDRSIHAYNHFHVITARKP